MATFMIFLRAKFDKTFWNVTEDNLREVGLHLQDYFNQACTGHAEFDGSDYRWDPDPDDVGPKDVLCYVLGYDRNSIVREFASEEEEQELPAGLAGLTCFPDKKKKMISEVYMEKVDGDGHRSRLWANIIFHELMHNKCDAHPDKKLRVTEDYHKLNDGVAKLPVTGESLPVKEEFDLLRKALSFEIPQYKGKL